MSAQPAAPPAGAVAVVGPQYCAPYPIPLTVTKRVLSFTGGSFDITDANGNILLQVQGMFSFQQRRQLNDAAGRPVLTMQRKIFSMHDRWQVFRGDSNSEASLLFSVKKARLIQFKTELDVFLAGNVAEQQCDFKIQGSYFDRSCSFFIGSNGPMIAQLSRQFTVPNLLMGKDTFNVTVHPNVDYVFIAALVVVLDEIHREQSRD